MDATSFFDEKESWNAETEAAVNASLPQTKIIVPLYKFPIHDILGMILWICRNEFIVKE